MGNISEAYNDYSLVEEQPTVKGWDKSTVSFLLNHRNSINELIRKTAASRFGRELSEADVDDIFSESLLYFYSCDDYNICKAIDRSSTDNIVSLDGYIHSCVRYCVLRYLTNMWKDEKECISEEVLNENEDSVSLYDKAPSINRENSLDNVGIDLEQICKQYEGMRYYYGADLYLVWYIKLLTMKNNIPEKYGEIIMQNAGISKHNAEVINSNNEESNPMIDIAKAVTIQGIEESIDVLQKYVYGSCKIKEVILSYLE